MTRFIARRSLLVGTAAVGLGAALPEISAAAPARRSQLAFLNHSYAVLDAETADAVAGSDFLRAFGVFDVRTTTNGQQTYTGRYLLGRQTYLEMFGPGDLPAPDDRQGSSGLALSPDHAGDIDTIKARMVRLGVAEPLDIVQTKAIDGAQVPWFRVVAPSVSYAACFPWVMEYLESYFADPRTHSEPASFPGDVSRERYNPDGYRDKPFRDVVGVEIAMPAADVPAVLTDLRAAGLRVHRRGDVWVGRGRSEEIVVRSADRDASGWRRIVLRLNDAPHRRHVERIGRSTLAVGPGPHAVWTFAC